MNSIFSLIVPIGIALIAVFALHKRVDVFAALTTGAKDGLTVIIKILPPLVGLLTAVYMLRASGALAALEHACTPVLTRLGIPSELVTLIFVRPISGSGALAVGTELIEAHGPDSYVGKTAAVILGSTETTFYTIAVYFGAVGIKKTRHAIPAAICADLTSFFVATIAVRLLLM